jgi:PKD repeat protein
MRRYLIVAVVIGLVFGAGIAVAQVGDGGVIYACADGKDGGMRLVVGPDDCDSKKEVSVFWNQQGIPGVDGQAGADGSPGENGSSCSVSEADSTISISCTDGTEASFEVPDQSAPLSVSIAADVTEGAAPLTVQFHSAVIGGHVPIQIAWDFDDMGSSTDEANPMYTFDAPGTYFVTFTAVGDKGGVGIDTIVIRVE